MSYNQLNVSGKKSAKRVGRGIAAGQGKTAGRGTKGQKSRTGYSALAGFEGGQNPLIQRFPKLRGFTSHRVAPEVVYTGQLDALGATVDNAKLAEAGLVSNAYTKVKIVVKGDVTKKHTVALQGASATAIKAIEKAGGAFKVIPQVGRPKTSTKKQEK
jgi:large subunit ribosomal protein L15